LQATNWVKNAKGEWPMTSNTIARTDLSEAVYQKVGLSRAESAKLVEGVLEGICATLASGRSVKLSGFGIFMVRRRQCRAI
jgi:integration host factor subunit alpha